MLDETVANGNQSSGSTVTDVSADVDQLVADLEAQVTSLQRLASLGTVSAMLAHEINNLITPLMTYSRHALKQDDPDLLRHAVEKTSQVATRLSDLCSRILDLASEDDDGFVDAPIKAILHDAVACVGRDLARDRIQVRIDVPDDLTVHVERGSLEQVIFNLVLNARQAMPSGGRLALKAEAEGEHVRITVSDTGHGIAPENLQRVFEPFFSTRDAVEKREGGGVGLGLHVVRKLLDRLHGRIQVQSTPGEGTAFSIHVPR